MVGECGFGLVVGLHDDTPSPRMGLNARSFRASPAAESQ
jgi:hypothetical protein